MGTIKYLLDTHTFLWAVRESHKLSENAHKIVTNKSIQKFVSAVSAYEIMNKYRLGKLQDYMNVAENYFYVLNEFGASKLPINEQHTYFAGKFEWGHRDPFDRLLAAQALFIGFSPNHGCSRRCRGNFSGA